MEPKQPPYDFIMNSGATPPQKSGLLPLGNSKKQRILIAAGIGLVLLIVFGVIFNWLFNRPDPSIAASLKMAQQHTELLRVSDIGTKKARSPEAKNLAATVKLTLQSSQDKIIGMASKPQKPTKAQLDASKNTKTDDLLTRAEQNNVFDQAFMEVVHEQIRAYLEQLRIVHQASNSTQDRRTLDEIRTQLSQLLPSDPS